MTFVKKASKKFLKRDQPIFMEFNGPKQTVEFFNENFKIQRDIQKSDEDDYHRLAIFLL
jgi:hypothetical protein